MEIVPDPHVRGRCLLDGGLQGWVWIERAHHREPRAIAGARHSYAAVIVGDVLQQPLDGVVGVGAFVERLGILRLARLAQHYELALGTEASANILRHEDETFRGEFGKARGKSRAIQLTRSVRRAKQKERKRFAGVVGREDLRV